MRAFLAVSAILCGCSSSPAPSTSGAFAVVELFTSEGCDSCPVAEAFANALVAKKQPNVHVITWHVDYFDDFGWKDPFAAPWATEHQQAYEDLNKTTIGTPEMFVNGGSATYVTTDAQKALDAALGVGASATVTLGVVTSSKERLELRYQTSPAEPGAKLFIVLVERGLVGHPTGGELAGHTLPHENVARARVVVPAAEGTTSLSIPTAVKREQASLIAFVQTTPSLRIVAATKLDLP